jgi:hypothetical protein
MRYFGVAIGIVATLQLGAVSAVTYVEEKEWPSVPELNLYHDDINRNSVKEAHWNLIRGYCVGDIDRVLKLVSAAGLFNKGAGSFIDKESIRNHLTQRGLTIDEIICGSSQRVIGSGSTKVYGLVDALEFPLSDGSNLLDGVQEGGFKMLPEDFIAIAPFQKNSFLVGVYRRDKDGQYRAVLLR